MIRRCGAVLVFWVMVVLWRDTTDGVQVEPKHVSRPSATLDVPLVDDTTLTETPEKKEEEETCCTTRYSVPNAAVWKLKKSVKKLQMDHAVTMQINKEPVSSGMSEASGNASDNASALLAPLESEVVLTGASEEAVEGAGVEVRRMVDEVWHTARFTHFISLPLNVEPLLTNFELFSTTLREQYPNVAGALNRGNHLHFTLAMLRLLTPSAAAKCKELIEDTLAPKITAALHDMNVTLTGLSTFQEDLTQAHVVHTNDERDVVTNTIDKLCQEIFEALVENKLITWEDLSNQWRIDSLETKKAKVKLHCTVLNSVYAKKKKRDERLPMDISTLMNQRHMKDFAFGTVPLTSLDVSTLGKDDADGFYLSMARVTLSPKEPADDKR